MTTTNLSDFGKNVFDYIRSAIEYNNIIDVATDDGSAIIMSKSDYEALMETLYVANMPGIAERIAEAEDAGDDDLIPLEEVDW